LAWRRQSGWRQSGRRISGRWPGASDAAGTAGSAPPARRIWRRLPEPAGRLARWPRRAATRTGSAARLEQHPAPRQSRLAGGDRGQGRPGWNDNRPGQPGWNNDRGPGRPGWTDNRPGQPGWNNNRPGQPGWGDNRGGGWHNDRGPGRPGWTDNRWNGRPGWGDNRGGWRNDWRQDNRYDWRGWRDGHRDLFRGPRYYAPYSNYSYSRLSIGFYLGSPFYTQRYWITDPWAYRLPPAYGSYRWVRYYDDVMLIDTYTGQVVDVIYDFFY